MAPVRGSWWDRLMGGSQHSAVRFVSLLLSICTAWAIYWLFSVLATGEGIPGEVVTITMSASFVAIGYFVTRGLAYRLTQKKSIWSYLFVVALYLSVEVFCNFAHAMVEIPNIHWASSLDAANLRFFQTLLPYVLSALPFFNIGLAVLEVDLIKEKMGLSMPVPKSAPVQGMPTVGGMPQAGYPPQATPQGQKVGPGGFNGLKNYYGSRGAAQSQGKPHAGQAQAASVAGQMVP